jgi:Xaa-Pro aminopeptidase
MMSELETKLARVRRVLEACSLEAAVLRRVTNFAWITCGTRSYVDIADTWGAASVLITQSGKYVITDNMEAKRLQQEQRLAEQGWDFEVAPWYEQEGVVEELTRGMPLGADHALPGAADLEPEMQRLRRALLPEEIERFRLVARATAEAIDAAIMSIQPGWRENQIAGLVAREALSRGVEPIVNLVGTDERLMQFRHPAATDQRLRRQAMAILSGRKWGLVASVTRMVYFGQLPDELRQREAALAHVDAHFIAATRPGRRLEQVLQEGIEAYQYYGYPAEWRQQQQGGQAGYRPREVVATLGASSTVEVGQVYAWSPAVPGMRSEDTILVGEQDNEVLTAIPRWPFIKISLRGRTIDRPKILEIT